MFKGDKAPVAQAAQTTTAATQPKKSEPAKDTVEISKKPEAEKCECKCECKGCK